MQEKTKDTVGIVGQYVSMVVLMVGIGIEISYKAHVGFICITIGGLIWGIATKIRGK